MEKLMYGEVKQLLNVTAYKYQDWALDPGSLDPRSSLFIPCHPQRSVRPLSAHSAPESQCCCRPQVSLTQCQRKVDSTLLPGTWVI